MKIQKIFLISLLLLSIVSITVSGGNYFGSFIKESKNKKCHVRIRNSQYARCQPSRDGKSIKCDVSCDGKSMKQYTCKLREGWKPHPIPPCH